MNNVDNKVLSTFNARYMSFEEIAKTFILSEHFKNIIKCEHTILTGSRGCGKTTLLKMLHPKALNEWVGDDANEIKSEIPFIGIYIPADRQWKAQLDAFEKKFSQNKDFIINIFRGLVNANILISICSTFSALIEQNNIEQAFEIELSRRLIDNWEIPTPIPPNLDDIVIKLKKMVSQFNSIFRGNLIENDLPSICYKDFIDLVSISIDCFEIVLKNNKKTIINYRQKWALCFDELEIAPRYLQEELIKQNLRSRCDQRIIFKLTSTPGFENKDSKNEILTPGKDDDYTLLKLWLHDNRSQKQWRVFCEKYLISQLEKKYNKVINIKQLLGDHDYLEGLKAVESYEFSKFKSKNESEYKKNGIMWHVMRKLQEFDSSFYNYLIRKNINPLDPYPISETQVASIYRKIKPIVLYRYYFTEKSDRKEKGIKLRSRNINAFNHGRDYIYDITDGNPRAFANIVNELIDLVQFNKDKNVKLIDISTQARIIESFSYSYSYIRIQNYPRNEIKYEGMSLYEIVDKIGQYFFNRLVLDEFNADPVIFFYNDLKNNELQEFIDIALEAGAIFKIESEIPKKGVKNNVDIYRLSYSLYPNYKLPKVDYKPVSLNAILKREIKGAIVKTSIKMKIDDVIQPTLFPNL